MGTVDLRMPWIEQVLEDLNGAGHRLTGPRHQIVEQIVRYTTPFTAEELLADLRQIGIQAGRATVYRTLELLHAHQWLRLVHRPEGEHGYVTGNPGHQHHLVCRRCGNVIMFEGCELDALLGGLAERLDFQIEDHWLEAFGICHSCQIGSRPDSRS